jgi:DNA-binding GntR family transcriptional regulator
LGLIHHCNRVPTYVVLKKAAMSYSLYPGSHVQVSDVADVLGISPTPVREALNRIHSEALVDLVSKQGFFARRYDESEIMSLYDTLYMILRHAIKGGALIKQQNNWLQEIASDGFNPDLSRLERADLIESVYRFAIAPLKNKEIIRIIENILDRTRFVREILLSDNDNYKFITDTIITINDCLSRRNYSAVNATLNQVISETSPLVGHAIKKGFSIAYANDKTDSLFRHFSLESLQTDPMIFDRLYNGRIG